MPASEPVPAVVATCTSLELRPLTLLGPATSVSDCSPSQRTATSLATSSTEPPPRPITTWGLTRRATTSAASSVATSGSPGMASKTSIFPGSFRRSTKPAVIGVEMTRVEEVSPTRAPTSAIMPAPTIRRRGWWRVMDAVIDVILAWPGRQPACGRRRWRNSCCRDWRCPCRRCRRRCRGRPRCGQSAIRRRH